MAHVIQVGAGSGGMPVLDLLCRDPLITRVTLIEPDVYKPHNIARHIFPPSAVGQLNAAMDVFRTMDHKPPQVISLAKKEELEQAIDKLKYEKAAMAADEYRKQLTQLLIELAKIQEALDKTP